MDLAGSSGDLEAAVSPSRSPDGVVPLVEVSRTDRHTAGRAMPKPSKSTRLMREAAGGLLEDGERVEAGLRVMLKGSAYDGGVAASRRIYGPLSSYVTDKAQARLDAERDNAQASGLAATERMGYGLTDRRILVWSLDAWKNRPEALIGEVPLSDLEGVAYEQSLLFGKLTLRLRGGHDLEVDVARVEKGRAFADALEARIG